jgi:hypothetical protein
MSQSRLLPHGRSRSKPPLHPSIGPSVTVAGAALWLWFAGAIAKAGGIIQSSQVEVAGDERVW